MKMDERAVDARRIRQLAEHTEGVVTCFGIRSRGRAGEAFAELTITVDSALDVESSHAIADLVEHRVAVALDARSVVVHVEPAEPGDL